MWTGLAPALVWTGRPPHPRIVVRMSFTESLRARGRAGLVELLTARPDLATPPPASLRALAARATHRASLDRALAGLDAATLQLLEAAVALARPDHGPSAADLARAVGQDPTTPLTVALAHALVWRDGTGLHPAPGLEDLLGPYPAGLGPRLTTTLARREPVALAELADAVGAPADDVPALAAHLADPAVVARLLAGAPPAARAVLAALTWGPPVGTVGAGPARTATTWLVRHGLLAGGDDQRVVLPREVALALREGRTHREPATRPAPPPAPVPRDPDADGALAAEEAVRRVAALIGLLDAAPAALLRSGGVGQRETRRVGAELGVADPGSLLELAATAGLIADDGEEAPAVVPTRAADEWLRADLPERWAHLATAWLAGERADWLVGTRGDGGALLGPLDPALHRPRVAALRRRVLALLAETPLDAVGLAEVLAWTTPRVPVPEAAVAAIRAQATDLGLLVGPAVTTPGRAVLAAADPPVDPGTGPAGTPAPDAAAALAAALPAPVSDLLLQGDLTGVVPGRPDPGLAAALDRLAVVESRGAATTVRFTEASIRAALDDGLTGDQALALLTARSRTPVPQALEYLVRDVARRHGGTRVGAATAYLRAEDPALLAGLEDDRALRHLGLVRLAPTVLASRAAPAAVLAALRERGLAPVLEGPEGTVAARRARRRRAGPERADDAAATARRAVALAERLLRAAPEPEPGTPDPVGALGLLREAAEAGREVWLELAGPGGTTVRRVRPLTVDAGRVRALDPERESELTVAVHRVVAVTPVRKEPE